MNWSQPLTIINPKNQEIRCDTIHNLASYTLTMQDVLT